MTYFTRSGYDVIARFYNRKLNTGLNTFYDNTSVSGTINLNNSPFNTPYNNYIRGGNYSFSTASIINSGQSDEKILYKWSNNINAYGTYQYPLYYEDIFSTYYKTKNISTISEAISSGSNPKSFRDTNNVINQVHESQGGVFYSRSTDNGTTFSSEEIVNYLDKNKDNKNAFISEIKQGNSTFEPYSEGNVIAIYQYREGNNENFKCLYKNIVPPNYKQWEELSVLNFSFTSQNPFNAKARIFAQQGTSDVPNGQYDFFTLTTYLYPNGNYVELKVKVGGGYPYQQEFTIDEGNIVTDYSVVRSTQGEYQVLYFAYIKNNEVWYKCFKFRIAYQQAYCETDPNGPNPTTPISSEDGQLTRILPDISLKNGYPIIAYRGSQTRNWGVKYETGNQQDGWMTVNLYPVVVRYKTGTSTWSVFYKYQSDGQHYNNFPNIEGSKDADAYLLNFKSTTTLYKQFVKLDAGGNYRCEPNTFSGTDAKLVRGCFTGLTGGTSYPMLMTLSPNSQLYTVSKQSLTITDQGTVSDYGFDNMSGVIDKNNSDYIFNLGPIFASNTTYGFEDSEPPTTVQNAVDFNNNMVSNNFSLSDNDTLIIGAFGSYVSGSLENFQPMKYRVNLISSTTSNLLRELFQDTVRLEDSVEAEYLRGFVITGIPNGTDSFYVQLLVDTLDGGDGDGYGMGGEYNPEDDGDSPVRYKRIIHFEKDNPVKPVINIPNVYSLSQNYPNPFNPITNIKYQIPVNGFVSLKIYDITGREMANLVKEYKQAGYYTVTFNGSNLASGVYFYRIQAGDFMQVKKMLMIK